jgi:penicillin amidase
MDRNGSIDAEWGEINSLAVEHPFAASLGPLGRLLTLPRASQGGSMVSLRVAAPSYGAILRMAVAPAAPENGVLQLAAGQSGHVLSPHFRDHQQEWADGTPTPFLAGEPVSEFRLAP